MMLKMNTEYLLANIGCDTAEKGPQEGFKNGVSISKGSDHEWRRLVCASVLPADTNAQHYLAMYEHTCTNIYFA